MRAAAGGDAVDRAAAVSWVVITVASLEGCQRQERKLHRTRRSSECLRRRLKMPYRAGGSPP